MKLTKRTHTFQSGKTGLIFEITFNRVIYGARTHGICIFNDSLVLSFGEFYKEINFKKG